MDLGQQMELMALHVVGFYKCPAAGDVVDASVDMEPIDQLLGGLGDLYCRAFLQVTVCSAVRLGVVCWLRTRSSPRPGPPQPLPCLQG